MILSSVKNNMNRKLKTENLLPKVDVCNLTRSRIELSLIKNVVDKFLRTKKLSSAVEVVLIGDQRMRALNKHYRRKDKVTDVLSFAENDSFFKDKNFLGQIIIDWQQIKRQAKKFGHSSRQELIFIIVHGLLHLVGYDDKTDGQARVMARLGQTFIDKYL